MFSPNHQKLTQIWCYLPEIVQIPQGKGSGLQDCPPPQRSEANHEPSLSLVLLTVYRRAVPMTTSTGLINLLERLTQLGKTSPTETAIYRKECDLGAACGGDTGGSQRRRSSTRALGAPTAPLNPDLGFLRFPVHRQEWRSHRSLEIKLRLGPSPSPKARLGWKFQPPNHMIWLSPILRSFPKVTSLTSLSCDRNGLINWTTGQETQQQSNKRRACRPAMKETRGFSAPARRLERPAFSPAGATLTCPLRFWPLEIDQVWTY